MYTLGTERKIMKLVDILNEQESPQDNSDILEAGGIIDKLKKILQVWETKQYSNDQERWEMYFLDIQELVEDFEEETSMKGISMDSPVNENLKKILKKEIRKILQ